MLDEHDIPYRYRDYREQPLDAAELRTLFRKLGLSPRELLRKSDRAFKQLGLSGNEKDDRLIELMAEHPTLLQRPIGVAGRRAVLGRPPEALLEMMAQ